MLKINSKILIILATIFLISCGSSKDQTVAAEDAQEDIAIVLDLPVMEPLPPRFPEQQPMQNNLPDSVESTIFQEIQQVGGFSEPMTLVFEKEVGWVSEPIYVLDKIFLGPVDNKRFLFMGEDDDVQWESPWTEVYFNPRTYYVYGKRRRSHTIIGYMHKVGNVYQVEFVSEYQVVRDENKIIFSEPAEIIIPQVTTCPRGARILGEAACSAYIQIYNAMVSIDFAAIGEVAPGVARDVVSVETVVQLVRSAFGFEPDVDSIRDEFLIPLLRSISNIKHLGTISREDDEYLAVTQNAYSNLMVTSLDSVVKIQKMAPQAFQGMSQVALGSALAYVGAETAGDTVISRKQPVWFKEIIAPIIREVGVLSIDLVLNGSQTSLESRLRRFTDMETQVSNAIARLCRESDTVNVNQCLSALN